VIVETETGSPIADLLGRVMAEPRSSATGSWLMINMITSVDGAFVVDGSSTPLGDDDDRALFHALRAVSDVVLVGAGTVRSENYRPVALPEEVREARVGAGRSPEPVLAIVTARLDLDPGARVFSDPGRRPLIVTHEDADRDRLESLSPVADLRKLGSLDGQAIRSSLERYGVILCEGGPTLNGHLFSDGVVDELNLTVAPLVVGGPSKGLAGGDRLSPPPELRLERVFRGDRSLFLRYVR
jgi:riboflavin biosynthesis pyrimidine reductase